MPQITVNGKHYELVPLDDLTLDEAQLLWDYAKLTLDQIPDLEGFHPGVTKALIHIAVARAEPGENTKTIRDTLGKLKIRDLETVFADISEEVEEVPPPSEPDSSAPKGSSGGSSSPTGESAPADSPENGTGSLGSATGAAYDRVTSVG
jgi:hypothetical protein